MRKQKIFITHIAFVLLVLNNTSLSAYEAPKDIVDNNEAIIQKLKKQSQKVSIDEALQNLQDDILSHHVLMFDSQSLQQASFSHPRVILFNKDASLVITFNGSPEQRGYESLETMRFLPPPQSKFIFEQIVFKKDFNERKEFLTQKKLVHEIEALEDKHGFKKGPNAKACITCHTNDPRPNWEPYSHWPGAYGQLDSRSLITIKDSHHSFDLNERPFSNFIRETQNQAAKELPVFINSSPYNLRYHRLINLSSHLPKDAIEGSNERSRYPMLSTFTVHLTEKNNFRIFRMLKNSPNWHYRKYLWFVSLMPNWCNLREYAMNELDEDLKFTFDTWYSEPFSTPIEFSQKIEVLLTGTGIEFWEASMSFRRGYNHVGFSSSGNWHHEFLYMLLHGDKDIKSLAIKTLGPLEKLEEEEHYLNANGVFNDYAPSISIYKNSKFQYQKFCDALIAAAIKAKAN